MELPESSGFCSSVGTVVAGFLLICLFICCLFVVLAAFPTAGTSGITILTAGCPRILVSGSSAEGSPSPNVELLKTCCCLTSDREASGRDGELTRVQCLPT